MAPQSPRFHRSPWWESHLNNHHDSILKLNQRLAAFAGGHRSQWLTFVDCGDLFLERAHEPSDQLTETQPRVTSVSRTSDEAPTARRYIPVRLMYDLLHLTPEGYRLWAPCLHGAIADAMQGEHTGERATFASATRTVDCIGRSCRGSDGGLDLA